MTMSDIENQNPENTIPVESHRSDLSHSFWHTFNKISKLSWQMSASYTFSMQMGVLVYLLSQLDDSEDNLAAITLITSLINSIVCVGISPLLAMSLVAGKELGELRDAAHQGESEEQLKLRREHISAVFGNGLLISSGQDRLNHG